MNADEKRTLMSDHLIEIVRLGRELTPDAAASFGVSIDGPETPDFQTARDDPAVAKALDSIRAAESELGSIRTLVATASWIADQFGLSINGEGV